MSGAGPQEAGELRQAVSGMTLMLRAIAAGAVLAGVCFAMWDREAGYAFLLAIAVTGVVATYGAQRRISAAWVRDEMAKRAEKPSP